MLSKIVFVVLAECLLLVASTLNEPGALLSPPP